MALLCSESCEDFGRMSDLESIPAYFWESWKSSLVWGSFIFLVNSHSPESQTKWSQHWLFRVFFTHSLSWSVTLNENNLILWIYAYANVNIFPSKVKPKTIINNYFLTFWTDHMFLLSVDLNYFRMFFFKVKFQNHISRVF